MWQEDAFRFRASFNNVNCIGEDILEYPQMQCMQKICWNICMAIEALETEKGILQALQRSKACQNLLFATVPGLLAVTLEIIG